MPDNRVQIRFKPSVFRWTGQSIPAARIGSPSIVPKTGLNSAVRQHDKSITCGHAFARSTNGPFWHSFRLTRLLIRVITEFMNVALYSRVSTRDKGQDVANQLQQLREFCLKQGWPIVAEFADHASGKRGDREQFQAMFAAASRREFDTVLFWSLDRFSREGVYETLQYLQRLTAYGVGYRSFSEQYLDSCGLFKDAVISILATIAKQERVRLSERTIAGLQRAKLQGRIGGRPRIQYDHNRLAELRRSGLSLGQIASETGLSKTTVARLVSA